MSVIKEIWKEHRGKAYKFEFEVLAKNVVTDSAHQFLTSQEKGGMVSKDSPISNTVQFTMEAARANIISGETVPKMMGKICKIIGDLMSAGTGFRNTTDAISQGTDADVVSRKALKEVNNKLGGVSFEQKGNDVYAVYKNGADTVQKKLGSGIFGNANTLVNLIYMQSSQSLQVTENAGLETEYTRYGMMSVFDLTILPDYNEFLLGENILVMVCKLYQTQDSVNPDAQILPHKKLQRNISAPINDSVTVRDFAVNAWGPGTYAAAFDQEDEDDYIKEIPTGENTIKTQYLGNTNNLQNMALYCPQNGKLYCISFSTSIIQSVSLYRI